MHLGNRRPVFVTAEEGSVHEASSVTGFIHGPVARTRVPKEKDIPANE